MKHKHLKLSPLFKKAEQALRIAVAKTLADHKLKGLPIFIWQENKVVRIPARRIHAR
jgi:hypothetical protein